MKLIAQKKIIDEFSWTFLNTHIIKNMFNCPLLLVLYKKGIGKNLLSNINFSQDVIVWEWRTKMNIWAKFKTSCLKCHIFPKELFEWRLVKDANVGLKKMPNRSFWPKQHHVATAFSMGFVFTKAQYHSLKRKRSSHHIRQLPNLWRYLGKEGRSENNDDLFKFFSAVQERRDLLDWLEEEDRDAPTISNCLCSRWVASHLFLG